MRAISIGYHDIVEEGQSARPIAAGHTTQYTISRLSFREHLYSIREAVGVNAVTRVLDAQIESDSRRVFLTVDDGAVSTYTCVAEEMSKLGWPGHFFITTDWIGTPGFLSREQIRELHQSGHVIGSHSCTHPDRMSALTYEQLLREWMDSRKILSEIIGQPVKVASVPGGYHSKRVAEAATAAGIEILFTSEPTTRSSVTNGCLVLGRYAADRNTPATAAGAIAAGKNWPRWKQSLSWSAKAVAKQVGGRHYLAFREFLLKSRTQE